MRRSRSRSLVLACLLLPGPAALAREGADPDGFDEAAIKGTAAAYKDTRTVAQIRKDNALIRAAEKGDVDAVRKALKAGARVNSFYIDGCAAFGSDGSGYTALMEASCGGHAKVVKLLIEAKADLELKSVNPRHAGETALYQAVVGGKDAVVALLVKAGARDNPQQIRLGLELRRAACRGFRLKEGQGCPNYPGNAGGDGAPEIAEVLRRGADVNAADPGGYTPLMYAANLGLVDNVKILLAHGADASRKTRHGETALSLAEASSSCAPAERRQVVAILKAHLARAGRASIDFAEGDESSYHRVVLFTPDDRLLLTVGQDAAVHVWDVRAGKRLRTLWLPRHMVRTYHAYQSDVSPDGRRLAVPCGNHFLVIDLRAGKVTAVGRGHTGPITGLAYSPDGKTIATVSWDRQLKLWAPDTGACRTTFKGPGRGKLDSLAWSPDGKTIATSEEDGPVRLWDVASGRPRDLTVRPAFAATLLWRPDGKALAVLTGPRGWSVVSLSGRELGREGGWDWVTIAARWGPTGRLALADQSGRMLDGVTGRLVVPVPAHPRVGHAGALSASGRLFASYAEDGAITVRSLADGKVVLRAPAPPREVATGVGWSADGKSLLWAAARSGPFPTPAPPTERSFDLARLKLGAAPPGAFRTKAKLEDAGRKLEPVGEYVFRLTRAMGRKEIYLQPERSADALLVRAATLLAGERAVVLSDWGLALHDTTNGEELFYYRPAHDDDELAPRPDGRLFVTSGRSMGVYSLLCRERLLSIHALGERWVAWTEDGHYAASWEGDLPVGFFVDRGPERLAELVPLNRLPGRNRPDVLRRLLAAEATDRALKEAARSKRSVEEVVKLGGEVTRDEGGPDRVVVKVDLSGKAVTDEKLSCLAGLGGLRELDLASTPVSDRGLAHLKGLTKLETLSLVRTRVTGPGLSQLAGLPKLKELFLVRTGVDDKGLAHVAELPHLRVLTLVRAPVTDAGLAHLGKLDGLWVLNLAGTKVTDRGLTVLERLALLEVLSLDRTAATDRALASLKGARRLRHLGLRATPVTGAGLAHLKGLEKLEELALDGSRLNDAGLAEIKGLTRLRGLGLENTAVSDAGLAHLAGLTKLTSLRLDNTAVTDAGLLHLTGLRELRSLSLAGTRVTEAGTQRLKAALPGLLIYAPGRSE